MGKILIVDDDEDLLYWLKSFLVKKGFEVQVTDNCAGAFLLMDSFAPHLLLLDINVGKDDGRETCKQIRSMEKFRSVPVVLISADQQLLGTYRQYDATAILEKPFAADRLLSVIQSHMAA